MPGDTLPLKVVRQQDRAKLETALNAPAPYTRLIAVVHILQTQQTTYHVSVWHSLVYTAAHSCPLFAVVTPGSNIDEQAQSHAPVMSVQ